VSEHALEPGYDAAYVRAMAPRWKRALHTYFRARVHGFERVPHGPFVAVGNHSGAGLIPDTLVWLAHYHSAQAERADLAPLLTLAHDQMFASFPAPLQRWVARFGAIPAGRARALQALREGYAVQVYPGGDHDACRPFSQRNRVVFAGRRGYVELARAAGVPLVPIAAVGGHETLIVLREGRRLARWLGVDRSLRLKSFPISLSVPWGLWVGPLPGYLPAPSRIELEVLDPILPAQLADASTAQIDARVRASLQRSVDRMARGRVPILG
jgi:1-acyl-sn-glycerol-3-phosphate acyltransferase